MQSLLSTMRTLTFQFAKKRRRKPEWRASRKTYRRLKKTNIFNRHITGILDSYRR